MTPVYPRALLDRHVVERGKIPIIISIIVIVVMSSHRLALHHAQLVVMPPLPAPGMPHLLLLHPPLHHLAPLITAFTPVRYLAQGRHTSSCSCRTRSQNSSWSSFIIAYASHNHHYHHQPRLDHHDSLSLSALSIIIF